jgi:hypothetical protein
MTKNNNKTNDKHPLSAEWAHNHRMTGSRISFFGKGITTIDKLEQVDEQTLLLIR